MMLDVSLSCFRVVIFWDANIASIELGREYRMYIEYRREHRGYID